ncbi:DUF5110 domain-containing protein [Hymenobacter nivis]|uniref:DUF5110 domain-containing protein n=1 Tax=Hymenobacter nivis TaxID=1850093 RepID=UPI0013A54BBC|nr:DUF5110 domain-containing protein [Hymenobacter nivis]
MHGKKRRLHALRGRKCQLQHEKGTFANIPLSYDEGAKTLTIGARRGILPGMAAQRSFRVVWVRKDQPTAWAPDAAPAQTVPYAGRTLTVIGLTQKV